MRRGRRVERGARRQLCASPSRAQSPLAAAWTLGDTVPIVCTPDAVLLVDATNRYEALIGRLFAAAALHVRDIAGALACAPLPQRWCVVVITAESLGPKRDRALTQLASAIGAAPVLLLLDRADRDLINAAMRMRMLVAIEPITEDAFAEFLTWARRAADADHERFATAFSRIARSAGLGAREEQVLLDVATGSMPKEIAAASGVQESTVRTQLEALRRKLNARSIDELRKRVLRTVLPLRAPQR